MELRVLSTPEDEVMRIALQGRLDLQGAGEIEADFAARTAASDKSAVIDLSEVPFLASIGMRMLLRAAKALRQTNCRLVILRPQENVKQALEVAGLVEILPITNDEADALTLARGERAA
jgi:anti-sigma B factor antagonist